MPSRTCLSCRKVRDKKDLVRLAARGSALTADIKGVLPGRGAYICPQQSCIRDAYKKKEQFSRSLKRNIMPMPLEELLDQALKHLTIPRYKHSRAGGK